MTRRIPVLFLLLAVVSTSCTSAGNQAAVGPDTCWREAVPTALKVETGSAVTPPKTVHRVEPVIPRSLAGEEATATIEAVIGEDGRPRHVCVVSGDPVWGRAVADALRQWTFTPATLDGKPVAVQFSLTTKFGGMSR